MFTNSFWYSLVRVLTEAACYETTYSLVSSQLPHNIHMLC